MELVFGAKKGFRRYVFCTESAGVGVRMMSQAICISPYSLRADDLHVHIENLVVPEGVLLG